MFVLLFSVVLPVILSASRRPAKFPCTPAAAPAQCGRLQRLSVWTYLGKQKSTSVKILSNFCFHNKSLRTLLYILKLLHHHNFVEFQRLGVVVKF
jgi:hypothetical protein